MSTNNTIPQTLGPYKLTIKVTNATLDRSTDMMGKMDPYAVVEFTRAGGKTVKRVICPTHKGGHKTPSWNYEFDLYYGGEAAGSIPKSDDTIKFIVYEEDTMSSDLVGESAVIPVAQLVDGNKKSVKSQQIIHDKKPVGTINFETQLTDLNKAGADFKPGTIKFHIVGAEIIDQPDIFTKIDRYAQIDFQGFPKK